MKNVFLLCGKTIKEKGGGGGNCRETRVIRPIASAIVIRPRDRARETF